MTVTLVRGARWASLVSHLAAELSDAATDPFRKLRVVVSSRATGRHVGQQVAGALGISAGISYLSPTDLQRELADRAGVGRQRSRWRGTPLELAVAEALTQVSHPLIQRALAADASRPGRRHATAARIAGLLRSYADHAPQLLAQWLAGSDEGLDGEPIPEQLSWQPALFRWVTAALETDPLSLTDHICAAARQDQTPTYVLAVDHLTGPQHSTIGALARGPGITVLQPAGSPGDEWASQLATEIVDLPGEAAPRPVVAVHNSHGEARQVAVLRDELTRAFAQDPTLEPRHVVVVCPRPERYAGLLDAAFAPAGESSHPGRTLRLQPVGSLGANTVLGLLVQVLRLGRSRATASGVIELLLSPPLAHRWHLQDRHAVIELVSGAGIRWGLDEDHRAAFDLGDVAQNTWSRGLDRLLIGLAVAPGAESGLGLTGTDAVTASDLTLVGALCEVLTRLRHVVATTAQPASVQEWVDRCREAIDSLVDLPYADQWQRLHALSVLARFESDHHGSATQLSPYEFSHLLEEAASPPRARVAAGNGALQVVPLGELQHVEFRLVAMLGLTDDVVPGRGGHLPDSVDLAGHLPDLPARRLHQLLTHATSAERVIIVRQHHSQRTNDPSPSPVAVSWLLEQLGESAVGGTDHPPTATSARAFGARPSFDAAAHAGAVARSAFTPGGLSLTQRRRLDARSRPVGSAPTQVSLAQLAAFLKDPARVFLRAAGNITLYREAEVSDEMPLEVGGLANWRLVDALVDSWKDGTSLESVERHFRQREDLPPQAIGDASFALAKEDAVLLYQSAGSRWRGEVATHPVDLTLTTNAGPVRLLDEVRTRSGLALAAAPSQQRTGIFRPWLESLSLTAQGTPVPAELHHFVKSYGVTSTESWRVDPLTPERALAHLTELAEAYARAQHRLLPVPAGPGLTFALEHAAGRFNQAEWSGPIGSFRTKWSRSEPAWRLFFEADVRELFEDRPLPTDPANGLPTAFQAWAWALYAPLVGGAA